MWIRGVDLHVVRHGYIKAIQRRSTVIREFSICTTDGFCDGKTSNVASSPQRLSGPLRVVESG